MLPLTDETHLLREASRALPDLGLADLTRDRLSELTQEHGVDWATALLFDRLLGAHAEFIQQVDTQPADLGSLPPLPYTLVVAPAAGYVERPEFGGDGAIMQTVARRFGMEVLQAPLRSLGSVRHNADALRDLLASRPARSVVLLSVSKGGTETRLALKEPGAHVDALAAWINVGGVLHGTGVVDHLMGRWRSRLVLRVLKLLGRMDRDFTDGFNHDAPALVGPVESPGEVPVINLLGLPLRSHLTGRIAGRHGYLSKLGPNDGYTLLADALAPGHVYPLWGASHYMRVPRLSDVVYRLFSWLSQHLVATKADSE